MILWLVIRCVCLSEGGIKAAYGREEAFFFAFCSIVSSLGIVERRGALALPKQ